MRNPDLVLFSPLPPSRNGIADYTASFLPALAARFELYLVIDDDQPTPSVDFRCRILRVAEYERHFSALRTAPHAYQMGNNRGHSYMLPWIGRAPGLVTIHDLSLHHLMDASLTGREHGEPYSQLLFEAYGQRGLTLGREVVRRGERPIVYHLELGFLPAIVSRSRGVVVHSLLGELRCSAVAGDTPVYRIAHAYDKRTLDWSGERDSARFAARLELNLPSDKIIISSLGFVTGAKRVDLTLGAVKALRQLGHDVLFVIAGALNPDDYDVRRQVSAYGIDDCVEVVDYVDDDRFMTYLAASDVVMNLRSPTMGETSGTLTNALAIGCCAVVTEIGAFAEIPNDRCVQVPIEEMTVDGVLRALLPLVSSPSLRRWYETSAAEFARREYAPDLFVERYSAAIEDVRQRGGPRRPERGLIERSFVGRQGRRRVHDAVAAMESGRERLADLWWSELLLPRGDGGGSLLIVGEGAFAAAVAADSFGWDASAVLLESVDAFRRASEPARADALLIVLDERDFLASAMECLAAANRSLRPRGALVLNVTFAHRSPLAAIGDGPGSKPDAASKRTSDTVISMVEAAGFRIDAARDRATETNPDALRSQRLEFAVSATRVADEVVLRPASVFVHY